MSNVAFRDSVVVVLDTGRSYIRAGYGLHDLLKLPSVEFLARVGLRKNASASAADAANALLNTSGESTPGPSTVKLPPPKVTDYLVGTQLDEAIASGQDITISWPFADGDISDWVQAEAIWKYVLFDQLHLRRAQMESPVLLSILPGLSRDSYERICQIFFERFNVAAFGILDRPVAQFYAAATAGNLSGLVVDIDREFTDVTPIYDGLPLHSARTSTPIGVTDCQHYLAYLLRSNQSIIAALSPPQTPLSPEDLQKTLLELAQHIWQEGLVKVLAEGEAARDIEEEGVTDIAAVLVAGKEKAVIETGMKKRANAKASAAEQARAKEIEALDLVTIEFRGHSLTLGKERHRFCEPLFEPGLLDALPNARERGTTTYGGPRSLQAAVGQSVEQTDVDYRKYILGGLFVTGELTNKIKGIGAALQARLSPYTITGQESQNEVQPKHIRVLKVPDYFAEYREKGDGLASFLGTSIVAKITFSESAGKHYVSKTDYTSRGPRAVLGMSPSLL